MTALENARKAAKTTTARNKPNPAPSESASIGGGMAQIGPIGKPWPESLDESAFIGPLGDHVKTIAPDTESDPAAIMLQSLISFGSAVGRNPKFAVGTSTHHANEFGVIVGETSSGRKGTSFSDALSAFVGVDDVWQKQRVATGLSSGEGLIYHVRDPVEQRQPIKKNGRVADYETVIVDQGECDKRALVIESEFVNVMKQAERTGNTLSITLRQAWETGNLRTLVKNSPNKATDAHISIIGHITETELKKYLTEVETANGFANRHIWFVSKRSKFLAEPQPTDPKRTNAIRTMILKNLEKAKKSGELKRDPEAQTMWSTVYEQLEQDRPGLSGSMLARAAPHVIRLSLIYALSEGAKAIGARHLMAALAIWEYSERSVNYLFGESLGDTVADSALALIRGCPHGISRTDIAKFHGNNLSSARLSSALGLLLKFNRARHEVRETGGRPAEWWFPAGGES